MKPSELDKANGNHVDEWAPEVGECEWSQYNNDVYIEITVHAVTDYMAIISEPGGKQFAVYIAQHSFRPIKSEAEKLRDEQVKAITRELLLFGNGWNEKSQAKRMYQNGFRMTRDIDCDIADKLWKQSYPSIDAFAKAIAAYVRGEDL